MKLWQRVGESELLYDGWRKVFRKTYRMNNGKDFVAEVVDPEGFSAAAIIALTPENRVVIAREFRVGPGMVMDELPGGAVDSGEDPEVAAVRELREETGYGVGRITKIGEAYKHAYIHTKWHYYLAEDCRIVDTVPHGDENEEIEVDLISIEQLFINARNGKTTDTEAVFFAYEYLKERASEA